MTTGESCGETEPLGNIKGVPVNVLADAVGDGKLDCGSAALRKAEFECLKRRRDQMGVSDDKFQTAALAHSGGGIRSATFCLGVMQAMAHHNLLEKFDYLSTVSGGGYIGSSVTWYTSASGGNARRKQEDKYGLGSNDFPYGTAPPLSGKSAGDPPVLRYLRRRGNYLTPGDGITISSGLAVLLRGIVVNMITWFVLLVGLMVLLMHVPTWVGFDLGRNIPEKFTLFFAAGYAGLALVTAFVVAGFFYSFCTWTDGSRKFPVIGAVGAICSGNSRRYRARRFVERLSGIVVRLTAILLVAGSIPLVHNFLESHDIVAMWGGPGAILGGIASALWGFFRKSGDDTKIPMTLIAQAASTLVIFGLLVTAFQCADWFLLKSSSSPLDQWLGEWSLNREWALWGAVAVVSFFAFFVNINYLSLHRFYRDRLMEAFMPDPDFVDRRIGNRPEAQSEAPAKEANKATVQSLYCRQNPSSLFHIINTNLVLSGTGERIYDLRGGDNFIITPLYSGSNATGWVDTKGLVGGEMTLATAMATSGAAADPHTGGGGVGLLRSWSVSFILSLLNIRLGLWIKHPHRSGLGKRKPDQFTVGYRELLGLRYRPTDRFLHLSDGGHFENLAAYELIRREADLIVVCDAGADPDYTFGDLQNLIRRAEQDFGATIRFTRQRPIEELIPTRKCGFPRGVKQALRGHAVAFVTYKTGKRGTLVFLKTTMVAGLGITTRGYKGENDSFPDQTTADQFFDEEQFEAYRELGWQIAEQAILDLGRKKWRRMPGLPIVF